MTDVLSMSMDFLAKVPRGDRGIIPWVITFAYFATAGFCFWAGRAEKARSIGRARQWLAPTFWYVLCGLLIFLGFNKQLDLQSDLTQIGRNVAREEGLYPYRRKIQAVFVVLFGLAAIGAVVGAAWFMRDLWKRYWLAFVGIIYLCAFVIIRAASFHHIDTALYHTGLGSAVNTFLELGGNVILCIAAWRAARQRPPTRYESFEKRVSIK